MQLAHEEIIEGDGITELLRRDDFSGKFENWLVEKIRATYEPTALPD